MFQESFKYYKAKCPIPDLSEVLDLNNENNEQGPLRLLPLGEDCELCAATPPAGLLPPHKWQCYSVDNHPGLIIIRNPFTTQAQRYWIARCLRDYPKSPNRVNLNATLFAQPVLDNWWQEVQQCPDKAEARRMKIGMRWTTLGYHHNWNTKVYSEQQRTDMPMDLVKLTAFMANALGFEGYTAEAAIVNYYPIGTTLSGHTDSSERNLEAPLFSFSFGQTAIFLIGGTSKEERPTALLLRSGDVMVMSKASRLCYHAVPRVMKAKTEVWNESISMQNGTTNGHLLQHCPKKIRLEYCKQDADLETGMLLPLYEQVADECFWEPYKNYMNDSRININVRQVLYEGENTL